MNYKCPHCQFPMLSGLWINDFHGLVEHEDQGKCFCCGTTFSFRLVGGKKKGLFGYFFQPSSSDYTRVEFWNICVPKENVVLRMYLDKQAKEEKHDSEN